MKYLKYTTRGEQGMEAIKYYPSDNELERISTIIIQSDKPAEISFRGQILKTRNIEILDDDIQKPVHERPHYDLDNPGHRSIVRMFEDMFMAWCQTQPENKKTFADYCASLNAIRIVQIPSYRDGKVAYWIKTIAIVKPNEYADLSAKWSALNYLRFRRSKAEENEPKAMLEGIKEEHPVKSIEEIDVGAMF